MMGLEVRCLLGVTVLLLAAEAAVRVMGRRWSAAERHMIWVAAVGLSLLLPVLLRVETPVAGPVVTAVMPVQRITISVTPDERPFDYALAARWVWYAGMAAVMGWWLIGFARVTGMVASSVEHSTFGGVAVRTCAGLAMPAVAAGPVILLPRNARDWPAERLEMVLRHELAHVRRLDLWWRLAATLACCLYWFHPLAWRAAAQLRKESEMACDDQVLLTGSSERYAENLVAVAREAAGARTPAAVMAMAKPRELEGRLLAVLDGSRKRGGGSGWRAMGALACGLLLVSPLAAWQDSGVQMKGTVRDVVGVIPGAKLVVKGVSDYTFETGPDGTFTVAGVPDGTYTIEVLKAGYAPVQLGGLALSANKTMRSDVYLNLGGLQETVSVDGGKGGTETPPVADGPKRIRVSGNVQAAKLTNKVNPVYPPEAKAAGVQGKVRLRAVVGKDGKVVGLSLQMAPSPELARSAMTAVQQWEYEPTLLNGSPVEIQTVVDVNYTLSR
ncbi:MAG TPA: M56 family metallopeptidase [Bryobacteraceae bacterium]|nr:M56 family metallopeptidase [Bryobacteraceae bacterium]